MVNNLGSVVSSMQVNVAQTRPSILDALFTAFDTWAWNFKSLSIVTPRSFSSLVASNVVSFMQYSQPGFDVPRCSILHFSLLNPICHLWDQARRLFKSSWTLVWSSRDDIPWNSLVSSTNIFAVHTNSSGKSLMYMTNKTGTNTLPWGMPLFVLLLYF